MLSPGAAHPPENPIFGTGYAAPDHKLPVPPAPRERLPGPARAAPLRAQIGGPADCQRRIDRIETALTTSRERTVPEAVERLLSVCTPTPRHRNRPFPWTARVPLELKHGTNGSGRGGACAVGGETEVSERSCCW
ncbi:hypothetical protein Alo02nite_65270 [Actinoplanes lobatus]|uniref:Uncharacterized protein n=1 Tax=Actinoplanes lobatus TaxID=113568 RepID=A0ABQ4ARK9_9ACTN|nr:hypothetical protein Alo02nite_65270 [Actinoplanes lobatus]